MFFLKTLCIVHLCVVLHSLQFVCSYDCINNLQITFHLLMFDRKIHTLSLSLSCSRTITDIIITITIILNIEHVSMGTCKGNAHMLCGFLQLKLKWGQCSQAGLVFNYKDAFSSKLPMHYLYVSGSSKWVFFFFYTKLFIRDLPGCDKQGRGHRIKKLVW